MKRILYYSAMVAGFLCLFVICGSAAGTKKVWVSGPNASLKADRSASSKTVADLPGGSELTVISQQDKWYQVSSKSGQKGWIYRGKISETAPASKQGGDQSSVGGLLSGISGSSVSAGAADTSRSIRGLSPEAKEYAQMSGSPVQHQNALDKMLSSDIRQTDIDRFLQSGRIGEYAE